MLDSLVSLTINMLDAACQPAPSKPEVEGAFRGPLWDIAIPHSKAIVPFILDYAKGGQVARFDLNGRTFASVKLVDGLMVSDQAVSLPYSRKLFDGTVQPCTAVVPFSCHEKARPLCSGQWTEFGAAKVQMKSLIPVVSWDKDTAVLKWKASPIVSTVRDGWLWDKIVTTAIKEIRISEFGGRVVFDSWIKSLLCPDMVWA
jgi:hypothetical protein